ncbi:YidH family protein [Demequina sp. NBRC 110055]|uniref:YidH family protein n=1 Tax=Demequina sp. NBRC 110055 TaxID=1570344 RepID=UPI0009FC8D8B|nr:DUF202 domain-containing protein [Demequina sp. NBRC 110055]
MSERRWPRSVYGLGDEPDARFSMANERTFLAWIRTAMAFIAGAVALEALAAPLDPTLRFIASLILVATGIVLIAEAWWGWMRTERALRQNAPMPAPLSALPAAVGLLAVAIVVGAGLVVGALS